MKQYMPQKPIKRGFKAWVRVDARNGYVSEDGSKPAADSNSLTFKINSLLVSEDPIPEAKERSQS